MPEATLVEAINLALARAMANDQRVILLGEDIGKDGGVFRVTEGLLARFGPERVLDTPLAEVAIAAPSAWLPRETDVRMVAASSGTRVATSITSATTPSAARHSAASSLPVPGCCRCSRRSSA